PLCAAVRGPSAGQGVLVADHVRQRIASVRESAPALRARRPKPRIAARARRVADPVHAASCAPAGTSGVAAGAGGSLHGCAAAVCADSGGAVGALDAAGHSLPGLRPLISCDELAMEAVRWSPDLTRQRSPR